MQVQAPEVLLDGFEIRVRSRGGERGLQPLRQPGDFFLFAAPRFADEGGAGVLGGGGGWVGGGGEVEEGGTRVEAVGECGFAS